MGSADHPRRARLVCAIALLALGCAPRLVVRAPVLYPARVPVRAFPALWVAGGALPEDDLIGRLAAHLARGGQHEVRRVEVKDLEPLRQAGAVPPLTAVVLLEPSLYSDVQEQWDVLPVQYCDFYWGCYTQYQNVYAVEPRVVGEVTLTVYDGPSARVLQSERFRAVALGKDSKERRKEVVDQLASQLERAVDVLKSEVRVQLEPVDALPEVQRALDAIQHGAWEEGRAVLERVANALEGQSRRVQARVFYDLGVARWYAPGPAGLTEEAYRAAERALLRALELDRTDRYRGALERLKTARQNQQVLEQQRSAAAHNFGLKAGSPAAP